MPSPRKRRPWPYFAEWVRREGIKRSQDTNMRLEQANRFLLRARQVVRSDPKEAELLIMSAAQMLSECRVNQEAINRLLVEAREGSPDE